MKKTKVVKGMEAFWWPEFLALAERLGIETTRRTKVLTIRIPADGLVTVVQEYIAEEKVT